jgi:hypothetical protein
VRVIAPNAVALPPATFAGWADGFFLGGVCFLLFDLGQAVGDVGKIVGNGIGHSAASIA